MKVEVVKSKNEVKTVFNEYQGVKGWHKYIQDPKLKGVVNVLFLGNCLLDGDMFSVTYKGGSLCIFKGVRGSEFDDPNNTKFIDNVTLKKEAKEFNAQMLKAGEMMVVDDKEAGSGNGHLMFCSKHKMFLDLHDNNYWWDGICFKGHKLEKGDKVILTVD